MAEPAQLDRDILKPLCGESLAIMRPFGANGWDCATNGRALLRLLGETLPVPAGDWKPQIDSLVSLAENGAHRCETQLSALRSWARGAGPLHPKCDCCGTPQELPYIVTGYIGAAKINVCLLSHYLPDGLPDSPVTVQWGDALAPLLVRAEEWQLVLMPLNPEPKGHRFVFDPKPPR